MFDTPRPQVFSPQLSALSPERVVFRLAAPRRQRDFTSISNPSETRGFTLIEILVVVVILGILAAIVVPKVMDRPGKARQVSAKQDVQAIGTALNTYKLDNFTYPTTEQGLDALVHKPSGTPDAPNWHGYLDKLPKDPWGRPYMYLHPGSHGDIDVFSYGKDGKPGGEGEDKDVGNWE